jgi:hypothetical protein
LPLRQNLPTVQQKGEVEAMTTGNTMTDDRMEFEAAIAATDWDLSEKERTILWNGWHLRSAQPSPDAAPTPEQFDKMVGGVVRAALKDGCGEILDAIDALRKLIYSAETSGGTAGRDEHLCAAIAGGKSALEKLSPDAAQSPAKCETCKDTGSVYAIDAGWGDCPDCAQSPEVCRTCDGLGTVQVEVESTVQACCGRPLSCGACCGYGVPALDVRLEEGPCPNCTQSPAKDEAGEVVVPRASLETLIETAACVGDKARTRYNAAKQEVLAAMRAQRTGAADHFRDATKMVDQSGSAVAAASAQDEVARAVASIETPPDAKGRVMSEMFWKGVYALQSALATEKGQAQSTQAMQEVNP